MGPPRPHRMRGLPSHWLGAPRLGLICYLVALTMAVISPAICNGARGLSEWSVTLRRGHAGVILIEVLIRVRYRSYYYFRGVVLTAVGPRQHHGDLGRPGKAAFVVLGVVLEPDGGGPSGPGELISGPRGFLGTIAQSIHGIKSVIVRLRPAERGSRKALLLIPDKYQELIIARVSHWSANADRVCQS